jgi:hypothetical protein
MFNRLREAASLPQQRAEPRNLKALAAQLAVNRTPEIKSLLS